MNKKLQTTIICMIMAMSVGCSKESSNATNEGNATKNYKSAAIIKDDRLMYKNVSTVYKEVNEGLVPDTEVFTDLELQEINKGVAVFQRQIEGNSYETLTFIITPELQKQLDDAGVYYHTEGKLLYPEYLSTMTIEVTKDVYADDYETDEEFAETLAQMLKHIPGTTNLGYAKFVAKIVDINVVEHNLTSEDLEIKVYDTIEKIDEGIRSGEINSGGLFTMGHYKILDQNTILATYSNSSQTKELGITPFIAEQLKASEDESFRVEYKEINGKEYIIGLTKTN